MNRKRPYGSAHIYIVKFTCRFIFINFSQGLVHIHHRFKWTTLSSPKKIRLILPILLAFHHDFILGKLRLLDLPTHLLRMYLPVWPPQIPKMHKLILTVPHHPHYHQNDNSVEVHLVPLNPDMPNFCLYNAQIYFCL